MIQRWDIVTIGNISRNRYWGESDERAYRPALCTCTAIAAGACRLLVDPSVEDSETMAFELDRRTGLKPGDIDLVFVTHSHGDHHRGLKHFARAEWLAAEAVAEELNAAGRYERDILPAGRHIADDIDVIHAPGHTLNLHVLRFDCEGRSVVIAGDAVMNREFFQDRRGYYNSADFALAAESIEKIARMADTVVPGHDNYFLNDRRRSSP